MPPPAGLVTLRSVQHIEKDCRACRMGGHDRAVVQGRHLPPDRRAPPRITRVALIRHVRVADLVLTPKLSPQALDQLVVPPVVRGHTAALDKQDLPSTRHGDPPSHLRDDANRYHRWRESIPGEGKPCRMPRWASREQLPLTGLGGTPWLRKQ